MEGQFSNNFSGQEIEKNLKEFEEVKLLFSTDVSGYPIEVFEEEGNKFAFFVPGFGLNRKAIEGITEKPIGGIKIVASDPENKTVTFQFHTLKGETVDVTYQLNQMLAN